MHCNGTSHCLWTLEWLYSTEPINMIHRMVPPPQHCTLVYCPHRTHHCTGSVNSWELWTLGSSHHERSMYMTGGSVTLLTKMMIMLMLMRLSCHWLMIPATKSIIPCDNLNIGWEDGTTGLENTMGSMDTMTGWGVLGSSHKRCCCIQWSFDMLP